LAVKKKIEPRRRKGRKEGYCHWLWESPVYVFSVQKTKHFQTIIGNLYAKSKITNTYPEITIVSLDFSCASQFRQRFHLFDFINNLEETLLCFQIVGNSVKVFAEFLCVKNLHWLFIH